MHFYHTWCVSTCTIESHKCTKMAKKWILSQSLAWLPILFSYFKTPLLDLVHLHTLPLSCNQHCFLPVLHSLIKQYLSRSTLTRLLDPCVNSSAFFWSLLWILKTTDVQIKLRTSTEWLHQFYQKWLNIFKALFQWYLMATAKQCLNYVMSVPSVCVIDVHIFL